MDGTHHLHLEDVVFDVQGGLRNLPKGMQFERGKPAFETIVEDNIISIMGWILPFQNFHVDVLTPSTSQCDRIWRWGLSGANEVTIEATRMGLNTIWLASLQEEDDVWTHRDAGMPMHRGKARWGHDEKVPNYMPRGEASGELPVPWSWTLVSRTVRK